jgi:GT2 family glycosyltransferase
MDVRQPPAPHTIDRLTVILVNFHSLANVSARLSSGTLDNHDVIIVDNGDDPAGVVRLAEQYGATAILLQDNLGFAAAVNRAVASVKLPQQPWLLLNPDAAVTPSQLSDLLEGMVDGTDGVGPLLADAQGRLQIGPAGGRLTLISVVAYFLFLSHLIPALQGIFLTRRQSGRARDVAWLCMACLVLPADAFARFGPVPETELVYAEDLAWGTRATAMGAHFRLVPAVVVHHDQGSSGAGDRWIGALERLCRSRLGPVRGALAVAAIRAGLAIRRMAGRRVA